MPDPIKTYSLTNKQRDLSPALHTVIEKFGGFLAMFKPAPRATNPKHEWHQDRVGGRGFEVVSYASGAATLSAEDCLKLKVGTRFRVSGSPAVFVVSELPGGNKVKATVHAANGDTTKTALAAGDKCQIITTPVKPGSKLGEGDETHRTIGTDYNYTQIIRKETGLTRTDMQTLTTDGVENSIARQTEHALDESRRDMSRAAIWGVRTERNDADEIPGEAGGLYYFANGGPVVDAAGAQLSSILVNDAAEKITKAGGNPTAVVCSPGQARVLGNEYRDKVTVLQDDKERGVYVAMIRNEANGNGIKIVGDPDFEDCDAFVVDEQCFGLSEMEPLTDSDSTTKGTDGVSRMIIGEFTFEFRNSKQRLCRIKGLKDPETALAEIRKAEHTVNLNASTMTITAPSVTVTQTPQG